MANLKNKKGVTLIELAVVMAILSIVLGVIITLLSFSNRALKKSNEQYDRQVFSRALLGEITDAIAIADRVRLFDDQTMFNSYRTSNELGYCYFDGSSFILKTGSGVRSIELPEAFNASETGIQFQLSENENGDKWLVGIVLTVDGFVQETDVYLQNMIQHRGFIDTIGNSENYQYLLIVS